MDVCISHGTLTHLVRKIVSVDDTCVRSNLNEDALKSDVGSDLAVKLMGN
jgi:hypothetical protein